MEKFSNRNALIHWISAIIIAFMFITGLISSDFDLKHKNANILQAHIFIGIFVLLISLIRVFTILKDQRPKELETVNKFHFLFKKLVQSLIYLLLIILPTSGLIIISNSPVDLEILESRPELLFSKEILDLIEIHEILVYSFLTLIVFHIAGIFLHMIRTKEKILKRMWLQD